MLMTMELEIQQNLEPLHAHEMLKELKTLFAQQAEHELLQTTRDFHSCRQEEGQSQRPALNAIRTGKVQKGNKHKKSHSQKGTKDQNQGKGKFVPKPKIPLPPKRENPIKDSICQECGEIGHWKRNCSQYLAELMKKKKNTASGAGGS
nr:zinc finger, CCHC-type [Tanacetum cinerariifolium]